MFPEIVERVPTKVKKRENRIETHFFCAGGHVPSAENVSDTCVHGFLLLHWRCQAVCSKCA